MLKTVKKNPDYWGKVDSQAKLSTCLRRKIGAVIVTDKGTIIGRGHNKAAYGLKPCTKIGACTRNALQIESGTRHEICRAIHAEQMAILDALYGEWLLKDSVLYCTNAPCSICARFICEVGIKGVWYKEGYPDKYALELLKEAGVWIKQYQE